MIKVEVVSEPQIMFESKAQTDSKTEHTRQYVSILNWFGTQLSDIRWGYETTSEPLTPVDLQLILDWKIP